MNRITMYNVAVIADSDVAAVIRYKSIVIDNSTTNNNANARLPQ